MFKKTAKINLEKLVEQLIKPSILKWSKYDRTQSDAYCEKANTKVVHTFGKREPNLEENKNIGQVFYVNTRIRIKYVRSLTYEDFKQKLDKIDLNKYISGLDKIKLKLVKDKIYQKIWEYLPRISRIEEAFKPLMNARWGKSINAILKKCKNLPENMQLGIVSDDVSVNYLGRPIIKNDNKKIFFNISFYFFLEGYYGVGVYKNMFSTKLLTSATEDKNKTSNLIVVDKKIARMKNLVKNKSQDFTHVTDISNASKELDDINSVINFSLKNVSNKKQFVFINEKDYVEDISIDKYPETINSYMQGFYIGNKEVLFITDKKNINAGTYNKLKQATNAKKVYLVEKMDNDLAQSKRLAKLM